VPAYVCELLRVLALAAAYGLVLSVSKAAVFAIVEAQPPTFLDVATEGCCCSAAEAVHRVVALLFALSFPGLFS
jgi:hypothetical protein